MMQNPGADNLIEACRQLACALDGKLVNVEIAQVVFSLELFGTAHARSAEVDAGNLCRGPTHGMLRRLRRSAAGNEDRLIFAVGFRRPEEVIVRTVSLLVLPEPSIVFEAVDRAGIRIALVEVLDFRCHTRMQVLFF